MVSARRKCCFSSAVLRPVGGSSWLLGLKVGTGFKLELANSQLTSQLERCRCARRRCACLLHVLTLVFISQSEH